MIFSSHTTTAQSTNMGIRKHHMNTETMFFCLNEEYCQFKIGDEVN